MKTVWLTSLVLVVSVSLAACGTADSSSPNGSSNSTNPSNSSGSSGTLAPAESNPVTLGLMSEFPARKDKRVTWANMMRFPQVRWSVLHMRTLVPTSRVWQGPPGQVSKLETDSAPIGQLRFTGPDGNKKTVKQWLKSSYTDGFIVLHEGDIAFEYYRKGMARHDTHMMWSVTKSVTGLVASKLIAQGRLDPQALVTKYVPELKNSAWGDATVQQTLDMTTAVEFNENYKTAGKYSDIYRYGYASGMAPPPDDYKGPVAMYAFLQTLEKGGEHGKQFTYRTVNPEVIGWIIQRVTGKSLNEVVSDMIWQPMGAQFNAYFVVDSHGTEMAGGGMNATLRDLARFADMIRNKGHYNGKTVISPEAISYLFQQDYHVKLPSEHYSGGRQASSYHNFWWLTNNADHAIQAWGVHGQIIHINPTDDVVIVKLSSRPRLSNNRLAAKATAAFKAISDFLVAQN